MSYYECHSCIIRVNQTRKFGEREMCHIIMVVIHPNLHNVTTSLISRNPRERMCIV